ncbi:amino acid adenylation domain-containing protein [Thalassococcus sp. BH17M4-6]|uniref:amino acid adenylation domain-containing protein n=1 Tax=Thalassococcus sp. BH17M4-6 TaxID=3413148 RepID=UPI003BCADD03
MLDQSLAEIGRGVSRPYDPRNFYDKFAELAARAPESRALLFKKEGQSYSDLVFRAAAVRKALFEKGISPGTRVAFQLDPGFDLIAIKLGILSAGCSYVPISNKEAVDRATYILEDSAAGCFVTQSSYAHRPVGETLPRLIVEDIDWAAADHPDPVITPAGSEAYVIYTSGTTGNPKGVVITHHSMVQFGESISALYETTAEDVVQYFYSPSVDTSVEEMCLAFFATATLSIATETERHAPPLLERAMKDKGVTIAILPLKIGMQMQPEQLTDLRLVIFGGEAVHAEIVKKWQAAWRKVYNGYGPTEATVACIQMHCQPSDSPPPIGRPMANHFVLLVDTDGKTPVPLGERGEIAVAGPGIAQGYLNRPDLTAEKFVINPHARDATEAVFYLTGDIGRWNADGFLEYHGRGDDQVKINGHRVEISEIENAFLQHEDVDFAAVICEGTGEERFLHAFVRAHEGRPTDAKAYWSALQKRLPFQMIPRKISFLTEVPVTRSGKVDRKRLPDFTIPEPAKEAHA